MKNWWSWTLGLAMLALLGVLINSAMREDIRQQQANDRFILLYDKGDWRVFNDKASGHEIACYNPGGRLSCVIVK